jgi:2-keto-4-pentenoate hydratase/2-oxohepta-3-ene-1,7-dioic acid hydratase in catechol pathway
MKIICIGRNYADHARELDNPIPGQPVVFLKPETALLDGDKPFKLPEWSDDIHHEIELVLRIDREGKNIAPDHARLFFTEVTVGIDFTARDVQSRLKAKSHPWERAKAFDGSAVVGRFVQLEELRKPMSDLRFQLTKNGQVAQYGHTADMLFPVKKIIAEVSTFMTLTAGDLIFTGTPAGVAAVKFGDELEGRLEDRLLFSVAVQ